LLFLDSDPVGAAATEGLHEIGARKPDRFSGSCAQVLGAEKNSNCQDGTKVVLCTKQGGGHEQGDGNVGWPFLKQFTLP